MNIQRSRGGPPQLLKPHQTFQSIRRGRPSRRRTLTSTAPPGVNHPPVLSEWVALSQQPLGDLREARVRLSAAVTCPRGPPAVARLHHQRARSV